MRRLRRPWLVPLLAAGALLGGLAVALPASAGSTPSAAMTKLPGSAAPRAPRGAVQTGTVQAGQQVQFDVALNVRDKPALTAYLNGLTNRKSPYYHQYLAKGQFGPLFGPTLAQLQAVETALTGMGLHPGTPTPDRLTIPVTATAAQVEHAFDTTLTSYRLPGGRMAFANAQAPTVPASVAPIIQGVLGLNDLYQVQPTDLAKLPRGSQARRVPTRATVTPATTATSPAPDATGPQPCTAASSTWPNTANVFADYYGMSQLYGLGDLGAGQRIGVMEFEPNLPSDISAFESCYGIKTPVNYLKVDGGSGTGAGSGEAALDIETIAGFAPQATIDVYQAPDNLADMDDVLSAFLKSDDKTMSISWGLCEDETPTSLLSAQANLADEATAQGQTILAASGDDGSTDCFNEETGDTNNALNNNAPAGDPFVVSVGGTSINSSGDEVVWNDSADDEGAGGGGLSAVWCMPDYQYQPTIPGIFANETTTSTSCVDSTDSQGYIREAPDVSANADPNSGYVIYLGGSWQGGFGGTSASTPLMASIAALTNASPFCSAYHSGTPGALPPALYSAVAADQSTIYSGSYPQVLRDITSGNNDYTESGYTGGLYSATKGYDLASGLGAPIVNGQNSELNSSTYFPGYTALMCRAAATQLTSYSVTGVSPSSGPANQAMTVTMQGTGFLPIAGADLIDVYSGTTLVETESPTCTTTACPVSLPSEPAGTVLDLRASVEDGAFTSAATTDQYTYVVPPPPTLYTPVGPVRVLDTRNGTGGFSSPVGAGKSIALQITGQNGVPAGATAVVLNLTATSGTATSYVTAYPDGQPRPTEGSNLNFTKGETIPNLVTVPVGSDGKIDLYNNAGTVNLIADLFGYYTTTGGDGYNAAGPTRVLDTRNGTGGFSSPVGAGQSIAVQVTGENGVPAGATGVVLNVTATSPTTTSYVTAYPDGQARPAVGSNLNFTAGETIPNLVIVAPGSDGKVDLYNNAGTVNLVADLFGYYVG